VAFRPPAVTGTHYLSNDRGAGTNPVCTTRLQCARNAGELARPRAVGPTLNKRRHLFVVAIRPQ
jgi:hypothetical protein